MTEVIRLRGQNVEYNAAENSYTLEINKIQNKMFSISDLLFKKMEAGAQIIIKIDGMNQYITNKIKYAFRETVPSKFNDMAPWHRYWYKVKEDETGQMSLHLG